MCGWHTLADSRPAENWLIWPTVMLSSTASEVGMINIDERRAEDERMLMNWQHSSERGLQSLFKNPNLISHHHHHQCWTGK